LSLRQRLVVLLLVAVAAVGLTAAAVAYFDARHEIDELLDAHLVQEATLVLAQAREGDDDLEIDVEHAPELHRYGRRVAFQLWERGSRLGLHSAGAPDHRMSPLDEGFSNVEIAGKPWRVFSSWDRKRRVLVQVGEQRHGRDELAASIARSVIVPVGVALPVLGLLVWFAVGAGLRPLRTIAHEVAKRAPTHLAPLAVAEPPAEVAPLVAALDRLFARVRSSIEGERRFTADAAHELRTPIAALRAQAQVARAASDDATRAHALDGVIVGCDRAARLVEQLLTLARLEPGEAIRAGRFGLHALAREVLADLAPAAIARDIDLALDEGGEIFVAGDASLVTILLRNVVDNAIRYSPTGTSVRVTVARAGDGRGCLTVTDQGPGVPAEERQRLGERFYRREGETATGSGLGLSIVRRIAELHGAGVTFGASTDGRGLAVEVRFPVS
jgi:two-component system sensor histidine kinase QseC